MKAQFTVIKEDKILATECDTIWGRNIGESFNGRITKREKKSLMPRNVYSLHFPKG